MEGTLLYFNGNKHLSMENSKWLVEWQGIQLKKIYISGRPPHKAWLIINKGVPK